MTLLLPRLRGIVACVLVPSLLLLAGCGGGKKKENTMLTGKVEYKGKPVTGGTLTLTPTDGKQPVNTRISGDSTYSISPPGVGEMKVAIETESIRGQGADPRSRSPIPEGAQANLPKYVPIPKKYAAVQTSGLSVTIQAGKNEKTFQLTD